MTCKLFLQNRIVLGLGFFQELCEEYYLLIILMKICMLQANKNNDLFFL